MTFLAKFKAIFKKLFGSLPTWDKAASAALTVISPLIVGLLAITDPAVLPVVTPILAKVQVDLATAATLIADAQATPTLVGILGDILTDLPSILELAQVKSSSSATKITTDVDAVVAELQAILADLPAIK